MMALAKNVEQVRAHGQDTLDAGAHECRGDDETTAGADAPGDETGPHADENGCNENPRAEEGGAVCLLAAQKIRQRTGDLVGKCDPPQQHRDGEQPDDPHPPAAAQDRPGVLDLPAGEQLCARHHEMPPLSEEIH
jgi:hypothetical protein